MITFTANSELNYIFAWHFKELNVLKWDLRVWRKPFFPLENVPHATFASILHKTEILLSPLLTSHFTKILIPGNVCIRNLLSLSSNHFALPFNTDCVKIVQMRCYFWSVFSCIRTEYRKIETRNNSVLGHFSHSDFIISK